MSEEKEWFSFQEKLRDHFVSLGLDAETNVTVRGVRTQHDIDVFVKTKFIGQDVKWIVEAKYWASPISKLHVLGLRTIVDDVGADKGFIISKSGFQSGAIEAAQNTNISLMTYEELREATKDYVDAEVLDFYKERIWLIHRRYWSHAKRERIDYELRSDPGFNDYSVNAVLRTIKWALEQAEARNYPINLNTYFRETHGLLSADNFQQLVNWMNLNFNVIDRKILDAEVAMQKDGRFKPKIKDHDFIAPEN